MRASTHLAFAGLVGVVGAGFGASPGVAGGAALAVGALLPDVDTRRSSVGRLVPALSGWLERRVGHRTVTHSLLGVAGVALLFAPLLLVEVRMWSWLLVGYASHLLLDTANVMGIPAFWPARLQLWLVHNRAWRVPYRSGRERVWFGCVVGAALLLAPLALGGFTPWFHRLLGTPYGAVADYLRYADEREVFARVRGANLTTGEHVDGEYRVVGAVDTEMLLLEDERGRAYSAGLGRSASITTERIEVVPGAPIAVHRFSLDLAGRSLGDLVVEVGAGRAYLTGNLLLDEAVSLLVEAGEYARVRSSGRSLELRSATLPEVMPVHGARVVEGIIAVRIETPVGEGAPSVRLSGEPRTELVVMTLPGLPSLDALEVGVGSELEVGSVMARYPVGERLAGARADLERAVVEAASLRRRQGEELAEAARWEARMRWELPSLEERRDQVAVSISKGAEPAITLVRLEEEIAGVRLALEGVVAERVALEAAWRERRERERVRLDGLRTEVLGQEERLVVRSGGLEGVVVDVRLGGVGVDGIDVEVLVAVER